MLIGVVLRLLTLQKNFLCNCIWKFWVVFTMRDCLPIFFFHKLFFMKKQRKIWFLGPITMITKGILIMSLYLYCNSGLWFLWFYQSGYCDFDVYCRSARACISNFKLTRFVTELFLFLSSYLSDMSLRIEI